jgi:hypothetical protein
MSAFLRLAGRSLQNPQIGINGGHLPANWFRCCVATTAATSRVPLQPLKTTGVIIGILIEEMQMKKALAILATVATVAATTVTAPAQARGLGPGLAFGLAAGAIAAGAYGAYGPGYGYYGYGPRYYAPAYYGPGPYAYYGGPYYRHRYWHRW